MKKLKIILNVFFLFLILFIYLFINLFTIILKNHIFRNTTFELTLK